MAMTTRKRDLVFIDELGTRTWREKKPPFETWNVVNQFPYRVIGTQETRSEGHPFPRLKGSGQDLGGNFYTHKDFFYGKSKTAWETFWYRYNGPFLPHSVSFTGLAVPSSNETLDALGTTAISRCKPLNPCVDASVALGELFSGGLPKLTGTALAKSKLKDYRKVGDEYLNLAFGWVPLVSDVAAAVDTVSKSEKILKQLYRDSGKNIRRRYTFPVEETVTSSKGIGYGNPTGFEGEEVSAGWLHSQTVTRRERWFSGCFTYHVSQRPGQLGDFERWASEARLLYGVRLTPDVLWNLTPWSWAADYIGNMGDVLTNISSFATDGLVMRYGYIMEKTTSTVTSTLSGHSLGGVKQPDLTITYGRVTKVRRAATPYGFGLNLDGLSPRQWAIMGALGISNGPKKLSS